MPPDKSHMPAHGRAQDGHAQVSNHEGRDFAEI